MTSTFTARELKSQTLALAFACLGSAVLVGVLISGNRKLILGAIAGGLCLALAYISGNLRLFSTWAFMFTLPFDLSKRLGPVIEKMGGESSFRIELSDPFLLVLIWYLASEIWTGRRAGVRIPKIIYPWLLVMLMGIVSAISGPYHLTTMHEVVRMAKVTVLFIVICNELERPRRFLECASALTLGLIVQSLAGLTQLIKGSQLGLSALGESSPQTVEQLATSSVEDERVFRISAFLIHPNVFGIYLAALLPLVIGCFLIRTGKLSRSMFFSGVVVGMAALIGTLSRSAWVSFAAAFMVLILLMFFHDALRRRTLLTAALAIATVGLMLSVYSGPIMARLFSSQDGASLGRAEYRRDAWKMIEKKPWFGWGLNTYVYYVPPFTRYGSKIARTIYKGWIPAVHNIYLLWIAETGYIGFAIHMAMLAGIIWACVGNVRVRDELLFTINAACMGALAAFLMDGFFSFSLRINAICRLFWVIAGMIMAIRYWRLRDEAARRQKRRALQVPRESEIVTIHSAEHAHPVPR